MIIVNDVKYIVNEFSHQAKIIGITPVARDYQGGTP